METNKLVAGIVAAAISIIVLAGVLMPVLNDATAINDTLTNEGYFRLSSIESTDDGTLTIKWDHAKPQNITVNDVDIAIEMPVITEPSVSMVFSDNFTVRLYKSGSSYSCQAYLPNSAYVGASTTAGTDMTITATAGTISLANTAETPATGSATYSTLYYPSLDGDWAMKKANTTAYVLPSSTVIVANGLTNVGSSVIGIYFDGNITDGYEFNIYRSSATVSNVQSVYSEDPNHVGVDILDKITFDLTKDDNTISATYSYFLVPYEIVAEKSIHLDPAMNGVLNTIPVIIIVAILLGVLAVFINRRE